MERVITNETAQADWKVKWGRTRTAFTILCFPQKMTKDAYLHSAQNRCIFTRPKRWIFSLGPKYLNFHSAQNRCIFTRPKIFVFFTWPKICVFSLGQKCWYFHSVQNICTLPCPKIFTFSLATKYLYFCLAQKKEISFSPSMLVFTQPKIVKNPCL